MRARRFMLTEQRHLLALTLVAGSMLFNAPLAAVTCTIEELVGTLG